jgi:fibronectin type 3 domain-containing protein
MMVLMILTLILMSCGNPNLSVPPSELTSEEDLSVHPPAPAALKAIVTEEGIEFSWEVPPPVNVPHGYSDKVLFYKVYRRTDATQFAFLAQSTETVYKDQDVIAGVKYYYTVTAMHENGIESIRPSEVSVTR